ncbi:pyridoxamine 5'-phosphate oxidase [Mesobaculum littorinae]|uniref:Pyridoxine/pyridoxamine 5'-phosphate oxidase n=1 Tax=Mesobaculum littorinae TaxID=2486419 RepID=A0A438AKC9_9RHOB|nr:pyridoxamine 5'-phosphate oxidase [Mesobaculum littorinae]RVV99094.1 pyridoxamine 5'-phosphate oxidase [Mesobaculum littorinae]
MGEGDSIFGAEDPFDLTRTWMAEAQATEPSDANAMSLATIAPDGMPEVRIVLLKEVERDALVFYTNYDSAKGQALAAHPVAALNLHWKTLERQVRVQGHVEKVPAEQSDAYYASRPLDSRLGAWASQQSRPLDTRETLMAGVEAARTAHGEDPARPPHWGGYRVRPVSFEFWAAGAYRLHDRERWTRGADDLLWRRQRLYP